MKPVLFVAGHVPAYRVGALAQLHELEQVELALFGGRSLHGGAPSTSDLPLPHIHIRQHELASLAAGGGYRAVVCPTGGRLAPLTTWAGARRAGVPLILWASLWAHPRSAFHTLSYVPLRALYRSANAVVTYGPHVSAYVRAQGAHNVHVASQSVDNDFWRASTGEPTPLPTEAPVKFLFVGRPVAEKGLNILLAAWRTARLGADDALLLAGVRGGDSAPAVALGQLGAERLRSVYRACDVLVVPSLETRTFREPWGLVVNEAMNQGLAIIASDAVGAAAGGLVRNEHNGLVVRAGDEQALAHALARLAGDAPLRARLGAAGAEDVLAYSHRAWAEGFSRALFSLHVSRVRW